MRASVLPEMLHESTDSPTDSFTTDNLATVYDVNVMGEAVMEDVIERYGKLAARVDRQAATIASQEAALAGLRELVRQLLSLFAPPPCSHHRCSE